MKEKMEDTKISHKDDNDEDDGVVDDEDKGV